MLARLFKLALRVLTCLPVLLSACSKDAGSRGGPREGFVGTLEGTDAFIAIVAGEAEAMAYVCNGEEEIFEWFEGGHDGLAMLELSNAQGGALSAIQAGGALEGEVTLSDGSTHAFVAESASGEAGLYRVLGDEAAAAELKAGWIVNNDGEQRGALLLRQRFEPAPVLPSDGLQIEDTVYPVFKIEVDKTPSAPRPIPIPYPNSSVATR